MALPTATLIKWLTVTLGWDVTQETGAPLLPGPFVPEMPDRCSVITTTPGAGFVLESAADSTGFQARTRGRQNDQADAEALAIDLDRRILNASFPAVVDGYTLIHVHRFGGAPSPLGPLDDADRTSLTASYIVIASI